MSFNTIVRKHPYALASGTREEMNAYHASSYYGECSPDNPVKRHAEGIDKAAEGTKNQKFPPSFFLALHSGPARSTTADPLPSPIPIIKLLTFRTILPRPFIARHELLGGSI